MNKRKGIILAGGKGTRLYPLTTCVTKQLLPVYDKPLIFYPIATLQSLGIDDILIITSSSLNKLYFEQLLQNAKGNFSFCVQDKPRGIADSFILGEQFIGSDSVCLILGDNIFYGDSIDSIPQLYSQGGESFTGNIIFGIEVKDPSRYGVLSFNDSGSLVDVIEKPQKPPSNYAIPGLYFFDNTVIQKAKNVKQSKRGELEIVDVIKQYINEGTLKWNILSKNTLWFDCGEKDDLLEAANMVAAIQKRTGRVIGDLCWNNTMIKTLL